MTDDASRAQRVAADPDASTWLSANAGSGKTRVLTDRVARLLLRGVDPENILCLTYTKAAASEMQNRLFKRLGAWAMLSTPDLRAELDQIGEAGVSDPGKARTLFARAIETPGGLKIQTIHSFCTSILRRFPLEAGVTPRFRELDDVSSAELIRDVLDNMATAGNPALTEIARHFTGEDLADLAKAVAGQRDRFDHDRDVPGLYDLPLGFGEAALLEEVRIVGEEDFIDAILPILRQGKVSDIKLADRLAGLQKPFSISTLPTLEAVFLYGEKANAPFGPKIDGFPTKDLRNGAFAPFVDDLNDLMDRVASARPRRLALAAAKATGALYRFAQAFLQAYAAEKERAGVLDFDDLILKTRALLTNPSVAAWVLYRLDGGIDHILVDEAQDTSPTQWSVIKALAEEMSAGQGAADDKARTLFVVGDKKQSIYSFQGADPSSFDTVADEMGQKLPSSDGLKRRSLDYSFRSAPSILRAVDAVFQGDMAKGLGHVVNHRAFHETKPGRVDLWPLTEVEDEGEPPAWYDPVDTPATSDPNVRLADQIAREIRRMLSDESLPDEKGAPRAVQPGDVLILVQGRSLLFHQIIRALKEADLPVAGADRLKIAASLAVRDVMALLSFLALPEDDLSLAAALKSPLFGLTEDDLFRLAHGRKGYLWPALRDADTHQTARQTLSELLKVADFLRPYELIERILTRFGGRQNILARLGAESEDGLNELLTQAIAYEARNVPTLTGFVAWMQAGDVDVKRQTDSSGALIRVMTVHGAKGLEAPIVFLPDTMRAEGKSGGSSIVTTPDGVPIWSVPREARDPVTDAAIAAGKEKDAEERRRLLYVAMTRAENWLVICGAAKKTDPASPWYDVTATGLQAAGAAAFDFAEGQGLRLENGHWQSSAGLDTADTPPPSVAAPRFDPKPPAEATAPVLSPSDLGGAKTLPGAAADPDSTARGSAIHRLLEVLPDLDPDKWADVASALAATSDLDENDILAEAQATLTAPDLVPYLQGAALTEVEMTAPNPNGPGRYAGSVDRLIVSDNTVTLIDFKTNREVPSSAKNVPEGLKRQMGAYLCQAEQIFPDHDIQLILLWTATQSITLLPHSIVREALARTTSS